MKTIKLELTEAEYITLLEAVDAGISDGYSYPNVLELQDKLRSKLAETSELKFEDHKD